MALLLNRRPARTANRRHSTDVLGDPSSSRPATAAARGSGRSKDPAPWSAPPQASLASNRPGTAACPSATHTATLRTPRHRRACPPPRLALAPEPYRRALLAPAPPQAIPSSKLDRRSKAPRSTL